MGHPGYGVHDTTAYRVFRMVVDHTWGPEEDLDDKEFLDICRTFRRSGGSWESLMCGDVRHVTLLEQAIDETVAFKSASRHASFLRAR